MTISPLLFMSANELSLLRKMAAGAKLADRSMVKNDPKNEFLGAWLQLGDNGGWLDQGPHGDISVRRLEMYGFLSKARKGPGPIRLTEFGRRIAGFPEKDDHADAKREQMLVLAMAGKMKVESRSFWKGKLVSPKAAKHLRFLCGMVLGTWKPLYHETGNTIGNETLHAALRRGWVKLVVDANGHHSYALTDRGRAAAKRLEGGEAEKKLDTRQGWRCESCDRVFRSEAEASTGYECQNCSTEFTRESSADGDSHRCPDCNKFASRSETPFCPDCGEPLTEAELVKDEATGEWMDVDDYESRQEEA